MAPQERRPMQQERRVLGIDRAPRVLHAVGMDERSKVSHRCECGLIRLVPMQSDCCTTP